MGIGNFRPISPIHSLIKIFIRGRCIQDNYLYVQGLARHFHRSRTPSILLKLDIAKAFDTVSWTYLLEMMNARGFGAR